MNDPTQSEDLTILATVEALEQGSEGSPGAPRAVGATEAGETLARLYTEVLGLISYDLEPVEPSAAVKARLMAAIHRAEPMTPRDVGDSALLTPAEPIRLTSIRPAQPPRSGSVPTPAPFRSVPSAGIARPASSETRIPRPTSLTPPPRRAVRPARWPLALAASLAILFAGLSGVLYVQLGQQRETLDALGQQLDLERGRAASAVKQARRSEADALSLREKFALVTSPAVEASPMRPPAANPLQPGARGVLFVASDHQHWYLCLHGVEPAPAGKTYKLWFMANGVPVSGGIFTARPGEPVELSSKEMPAGTKAVKVTLEADPQAPKPAGPEVLQAAGVYQLS
ncbi:MAG TPA: anti-sigma factor [Thermoanaerobaculia bacterium]|nr:anti-sigma factor [Thermoanaerobaculia bacterium]